MSIADWLEWLASKREAVLSLSFLVGFFAAALAETLYPHRKPGQEFGARWRVNATLALGSWMMVAWLVPDSAQVAAQLGLTAVTPAGVWLSEHPILGTVTSVLLIDMARYWVHRLSHRVNWIWRLHAIHHSDTDLDAMTGVRHHPFEYLVVLAIMAALYVILGIPAAALVIYGVLAASITPFSHANTKLPDRIERTLDKVFITNRLHALHHSVDIGEANSNFGVVFSIWDRIFATRKEPSIERFTSARFGVEGVSAAAAASLRQALMQPFGPGAPTRQPIAATTARVDQQR